MSRLRSMLLLVLALCVVSAGCGHEKARSEAEGSKEKDVPSFKEGKGLFLPEETRQSIGLEVADVNERNLAPRLTAEVQVYEKGSGAVCYASGSVSEDHAKWLYPGQRVSFASQSGETIDGKLLRIEKQTQPMSSQAEVVVEIPIAGTVPALGTFFTATIISTNKESVTTIPRSALLRAAQGDFVYVVNGERLMRTPVTVGDDTEGFVQIKDGLYAGDKVVVKPVQTLWLTELRLTKAGGDAD